MAKRKSIHIPGMEHGAPIPNGVVIGNMVFSSAIVRQGRQDRRAVDGSRRAGRSDVPQPSSVHGNRGRDAGPDRLHEGLFERRKVARLGQQGPWLKMFPDEHDRPARHASKPICAATICFRSK